MIAGGSCCVRVNIDSKNQRNSNGRDKSVQISRVPYNFFSFKNESFIALNFGCNIISVNLSAAIKIFVILCHRVPSSCVPNLISICANLFKIPNYI